MARLHGRNGLVYLAATSGAAATPLAFVSDYTLSFSTDKQDATAMGDPNRTYVAGLPDCSGDFSGFYDDSTNQTYTAATDGLPRNFYLYPNKNVSAAYWYGQILPDFEISGGVADVIKFKASFSAAGPILKSV